MGTSYIKKDKKGMDAILSIIVFFPPALFDYRRVHYGNVNCNRSSTMKETHRDQSLDV